MTGQGGWPMTVVCTPDGRPFFAGTYFPKERRGGMIGFVELCERIDELWHTQRDDLLEQADQLTGALGRSALVVPGDGLPTAERRRRRGRPAARRVTTRVGRARRRAEVPAADGPGGAGGRGRAAATSARSTALTTSLDAMAAGGIYDHLGGGFARYAVDGVWLVPHFEKMLYDNALLIRLYLHGWQLTGEERLPPGARPRRSTTCCATCASPAGGIVLGRGRRQRGRRGQVLRVDRHRGARGARRATPTSPAHWYGFRPGGNFEHGTTIPNRMHARGELARPPEVEAARQALFDGPRRSACGPASTTRCSPSGTPTSWPRWPRRAPPPASRPGSTRPSRRPSSCSPTCAAPTGAGCGPGRPTPAPATSPTPPTTAPSSMRSPAWPRPPARPAGSPRPASAADALLDLFWDDEHGGVFTTGHDAEALIARPKDLMDNATPGANGLAAVGLLRLAALTGDDRYREHGEAIVRLLGAHGRGAPDRLRPRARPPSTSSPAAPPRSSWPATDPTCSRSSARGLLPDAVLAWGERYDSPLWEGRDDGRAYVARATRASSRAEDVDTLEAQLAASRRASRIQRRSAGRRSGRRS